MHKPSRVTVFIFIGSQFTVIHSLCTLENSDVNTSFITGLKKVLSGCSRQVHGNFSTGQVTFHSHLPNGLKGFNTHMQASRPPTKYKKKYTKNAQGEQTLRAACPKGKLEYKFFFQHCLSHMLPAFNNSVPFNRFSFLPGLPLYRRALLPKRYRWHCCLFLQPTSAVR